MKRVIQYDPLVGTSIQDAAQAMCRIADANGARVEADFNRVAIAANPGDDPADIVAGFMTKLHAEHAAWKASPAGVAAAAARAENERIIAEEAAKPLATFRFADGGESKWAAWLGNNRDTYGSAVMRYAARWAHAMEAALADGATVADIASETSHKVDIEGCTGFQVGCATSVLVQCWAHGPELARWREARRDAGVLR